MINEMLELAGIGVHPATLHDVEVALACEERRLPILARMAELERAADGRPGPHVAAHQASERRLAWLRAAHQQRTAHIAWRRANPVTIGETIADALGKPSGPNVR
ncbi:MAG: hypothetical protein NW201_12315 [Gemmatimonadales bacterium]|nr:hypothetical protein [Gemmatimonadales bacterium]